MIKPAPFLLWCCLFLVSTTILAQPVAPVLFKGDTLFVIETNIGTFSPKQRAEMVQQNIRRLAKLPLAQFDSIQVIDYETNADLVYQDEIIAAITQKDAALANKSPLVLATEHQQSIRQALINDYKDNSIEKLSKDIGLFILALIGFLFFFWLVNAIFDYFRRNLKKVQYNVFFRNNRFLKFFDLISPETERGVLLFLLRMLRFTALGIFLYFYLPFMFSQISYTRGFGEQLMEYVLKPIRFLGISFTSFLPNLLFIFVIVIAVKYLISAMTYVAQQVRTEKITVSGFFPDWAFPTLNLFRVLVIIFTLVIIFPYLPGAGSDAFQGISVFVGLLISLGSAGVIGNVISGIILTYMRPFTIGDRVKINEITGDVINKNLLVTRIKTPKNEEITIPNATLLGGGVINYTALTKEHGLIVHTQITIGYDVPWKQVHELLVIAALRTEWIDQAPTPFVLQKSLDDWSVAYKLNAYTRESHKIPRIYSDLHANIQDVFNEAGLEIMSPHFLALRDGNSMVVPKDYLPKDYEIPTFRVNSKNDAPTSPSEQA